MSGGLNFRGVSNGNPRPPSCNSSSPPRVHQGPPAKFTSPDTFANRPVAQRSLSGQMDNIQSIDPRRLELFEARFQGSRLMGPTSQLSSSVSVTSVHSSEVVQDNSNLSARSGSHSDKEDITGVPTPEKAKTPTERKRKRKAPVDPQGDNSGPGKSVRGDNAKKISEYFKTGTSPRRSAGGSTCKSPTPLNQGYQPPSPHCLSGSLSNSSFHSTSASHKFVQTELTSPQMKQIIQATTGIEQRNSQMNEMQKQNGDLQHQVLTLQHERDELSKRVTAQQKLLEKHKETQTRCTEMLKTLLLEKSELERKTQRQKTMENRLRLGQFQSQGHGLHSYVENWVDGYAFTEITKRQEELTRSKEELGKARQLLLKKKPTSMGGAQGGKKEFLKPGEKSLTIFEYHEQDELLKLRAAALKKEDADLQSELEKLERVRNLHIRELKRIHNEDNSRFNNFAVLNDRYLLLNLLGKGGFSEVHKAFDLKEYRYVACKIHQLNRDWKEDKKANYIKHALRECRIHQNLEHPRIVKLFDVFEIDNNSFCTVLDFCSGNDLDFHLKQNKLMPEKEARSVVIQVANALKYLNEIKPPVIHYDLKPGNILMGSGASTGEIKITDFGLSKVMEGDTYSQESGLDLTSQGAGTYWYLPPECFIVGKEPPKISSKVDVWSVGVIFYQMLYGRKPFGHNLSQAAILEENTILKAKEVQFPSKPLVSSEAKNFIRRCLQYRKEFRPEVSQLVEEEYLKPTQKSKSNAMASYEERSNSNM